MYSPVRLAGEHTHEVYAFVLWLGAISSVGTRVLQRFFLLLCSLHFLFRFPCRPPRLFNTPANKSNYDHSDGAFLTPFANSPPPFNHIPDPTVHWWLHTVSLPKTIYQNLHNRIRLGYSYVYSIHCVLLDAPVCTPQIIIICTIISTTTVLSSISILITNMLQPYTTIRSLRINVHSLLLINY